MQQHLVLREDAGPRHLVPQVRLARTACGPRHHHVLLLLHVSLLPLRRPSLLLLLLLLLLNPPSIDPSHPFPPLLSPLPVTQPPPLLTPPPHTPREAKDKVSSKCKAELFKMQRAAARDYRADPAMQDYCKADAEKLCSDVKEGGGRKQACLVGGWGGRGAQGCVTITVL